MKLYTLEEIKETLKAIDCEEAIETFIEFADPIELPSDEEIRERAEEGDDVDDNDDLSAADEYERGAKWMKEQILNQNK